MLSISAPVNAEIIRNLLENNDIWMETLRTKDIVLTQLSSVALKAILTYLLMRHNLRFVSVQGARETKSNDPRSLDSDDSQFSRQQLIKKLEDNPHIPPALTELIRGNHLNRFTDSDLLDLVKFFSSEEHAPEEKRQRIISLILEHTTERQNTVALLRQVDGIAESLLDALESPHIYTNEEMKQLLGIGTANHQQLIINNLERVFEQFNIAMLIMMLYTDLTDSELEILSEIASENHEENDYSTLNRLLPNPALCQKLLSIAASDEVKTWLKLHLTASEKTRVSRRKKGGISVVYSRKLEIIKLKPEEMEKVAWLYNRQGVTATTLAAMALNPPLLEILIRIVDMPPDLTSMKSPKDTVLHAVIRAARENNSPELESIFLWLLALENINLKKKNKRGATALDLAIELGLIEQAKHMAECGAPLPEIKFLISSEKHLKDIVDAIDFPDTYWKGQIEAFHYLYHNPRVGSITDFAQTLIQRGVPVDGENQHEQTALQRILAEHKENRGSPILTAVPLAQVLAANTANPSRCILDTIQVGGEFTPVLDTLLQRIQMDDDLFRASVTAAINIGNLPALRLLAKYRTSTLNMAGLVASGIGSWLVNSFTRMCSINPLDLPSYVAQRCVNTLVSVVVYSFGFALVLTGVISPPPILPPSRPRVSTRSGTSDGNSAAESSRRDETSQPSRPTNLG